MKQIIIKNKDGTKEEIIELPNYIFQEVINYAKKKHKKYQKDKKEGRLAVLFG